jgi:hypothetical protein
MNVQEMPPVSASANNMSVAGRPPMLGAQVPGTTGGLPAQGGLSVAKNPMAEQLQGYGRNGDSMLVHMTPGEVGGLQQLAMAMGGSLTTNPDTGLPEANFLKKLLPTLLGAGLSFIPGVGPLLAAGIVGGGQTLLTGDINKGLMAGLGAFGGSALAGAAGAGSVFGAKAAAAKAAAGAGAGAGAAPTAGFSGALNVPGMPGLDVAATQFTPAMSIAGLPGAASIAPTAASAAAPAAAAAKTGLAGFGQKFGQAASAGLGKGMAAKAAPYLAGAGLFNTLSEASTPTVKMPENEDKWDYKGPYLPQPRKVRFRTPEEMRESGGAEFSFFEDANPYPGYMPAPGMAEGGLAALPAAGDFQATLDFFNQSPGAITASMYPTEGVRSAGRGAGEKAYEFAKGNPPPAPGTTGPNSSAGTGGETTGTPPIVSNSNTMGANNLQNSVSDTQFQIDLRNGVFSPDPRGPFVLDPSLPGTKLDAVKVSGEGIMPDFKLDSLRVNPVDMPVNGTYSPLSPGTTIPGMEVSGDGIMPNFTLDSLKVDPVIIPRTNISSGYGASNSMGGYRGEFGGSSPFGGDMGGSLNSMGSFGNNLDSRISGGNYTFPTATFESSSPFSISSPFGGMGSIYGGEFGGGSVFKDPEDYVEEKARGGEVGMEDGSFVVDARTVSELGNGSSNAGIEHLARMGGRPVRGGGDGVSDSVPARIGGHQKARVARDEVIFSPEAVSRLGSGSHSKGTKKLYALMSKAHSARKKAGRGQDTKVAKGLGALR